MYYPSSENKGADQLCGYREADLRLCFRLCRLLVFPWGGSYLIVICSCKHCSFQFAFQIYVEIKYDLDILVNFNSDIW